MAFKNLPTELVVPADATTGTARIIITKTIPPELVATPPVGSFISIILFMSTSDNTYAFMGVTGAGELSIGYCQAGTVAYLMAMTSDQLYITSAIYQDTNDFSTKGIWEQFTVPGYQNGWTDLGGAFVRGQFRLVGSPANSLELVGFLKPSATRGIGTVIVNLPVGYRPASSHRIMIEVDSTTAGAETPALGIDSTGNISLATALTVGVNFVYLNTIIPLDA